MVRSEEGAVRPRPIRWITFQTPKRRGKGCQVLSVAVRGPSPELCRSLMSSPSRGRRPVRRALPTLAVSAADASRCALRLPEASSLLGDESTTRHALRPAPPSRSEPKASTRLVRLVWPQSATASPPDPPDARSTIPASAERSQTRFEGFISICRTRATCGRRRRRAGRRRTGRKRRAGSRRPGGSVAQRGSASGLGTGRRPKGAHLQRHDNLREHLFPDRAEMDEQEADAQR